MTSPPPAASPPPATPQITTPTPEETQAIADSAHAAELRALAQELIKSGELGFDPSTLVKGTVTAFDFAGTPPTLTINIGGDESTPVSDVRLLNNYSPEVGHTVLVAKQGPQIVVLGHISELSAFTADGGAGGWVRASLTYGTHNGNDEGDVYYRRIQDHGSWKVQWRGSWVPAAGNYVMLEGASTLDADAYRPAGNRSVVAARSGGTGANPACHITFDSGGTVYLNAAETQAGAATVTADVGYKSGNVGSSTNANSSGDSSAHLHLDGSGVGNTGFNQTNHTHAIGHAHDMSHDHSFSGGSHTHPVVFPDWVSLNGVEYFL